MQSSHPNQPRKRPWDKSLSRPTIRNNTHNASPQTYGSFNNYPAKNNDDLGIPFVSVQGKQYYADRFYQNAPTGLTSYHNNKKSSSTSATATSSGQEEASSPPLFDRAELIKSLDLIAVIASTYTIDLDWLSNELPMMFSPINNKKETTADEGDINSYASSKSNHELIPVLVLHGDKRINAPKNEALSRSKKLVHDEQIVESVNSSEEQEPTHSHSSILKVVQNLKQREGNRKRNRSTKKRKSRELCSKRTSVGGDGSPKTKTLQKDVKEVIEIDDDDDDDNDDDNGNDNDLHESTPDLPERTKKEPSPRANGYTKNRYHKNLIVNVVRLAAKRKRTLYEPPEFEDDDENDTDTDEEEETNNESSCLNNSPPSQSKAARILEKEVIKQESSCLNSLSPQSKSKANADTNFRNPVYLTEVLPRFVPQSQSNSLEGVKMRGSGGKKSSDTIDLTSDTDDESSPKGEHNHVGVDSKTLANRKSCLGVHHSKYMLLFERSGSVIVTVSTSNLTCSSAVDATWIQRFEPWTSQRSDKEQIVHNSGDKCDGSDFGHVLSDFLFQQSAAAREGQMLPIEFLRIHLDKNLKSLHDLQLMFRFHTAGVHLVSTVPGIHRINGHVSPTNGRNRSNIMYGPQRVNEITSRLQERHTLENDSNNNRKGKCHLKSWIPKEILSNNDRLIIQTTSIGSEWKGGHLEDLAKQYLSLNVNEMSSTKKKNIVDRVDIVWPSKEFMENARRKQDLVVINRPGLLGLKSPNTDGYTTFLSSKTFNSLDSTFLLRMAKYETSPMSPDLPIAIPPHMKTFSRTLTFNMKENASDNLSVEFAWIMLTSACLSHGAQGKSMREGGCFSEKAMFSNFELGVLFHSRLQGNSRTDRLYSSCPPRSECFNEAEGNHRTLLRVGAKTLKPKHIPLPIPFKMPASMYQLRQDDEEFSETPCLHEITPETEMVGNMLLTPFGREKLRRHN